MNSIISRLRNFFTDKCSAINKKIIHRNRSINSKQLLTYLFHLPLTNSSVCTNTNLKIDKIMDVSKQAIEKKVSLLDNKILNDLMIYLHEHIKATNIFVSDNIYAVDGTKLSLSKKVDGFNFTKNGKYKKALLSTLFSVNNKIPINFDLSPKYNEIQSFIDNLFCYVKKNDTVIFDRGYYSLDLVKKINDKGVYFICRMKDNSLLLDKNSNLTYDITKNLDGFGNIRIIKYTINKESYYLSTNRTDKDIEYYKNLYHDRWYIEEFFKKNKEFLSLKQINYKKINRIKQFINMHFIIILLTRFLEEISIKYIKKLNKNYTINHKNSLMVIGEKLIRQLLFKKSNKKIIEMLEIINKTVSYNKPDRHFERISIKPPTKWYNIFINKKNNSKKDT